MDHDAAVAPGCHRHGQRDQLAGLGIQVIRLGPRPSEHAVALDGVWTESGDLADRGEQFLMVLGPIQHHGSHVLMKVKTVHPPRRPGRADDFPPDDDGDRARSPGVARALRAGAYPSESPCGSPRRFWCDLPHLASWIILRCSALFSRVPPNTMSREGPHPRNWRTRGPLTSGVASAPRVFTCQTPRADATGLADGFPFVRGVVTKTPTDPRLGGFLSPPVGGPAQNLEALASWCAFG
jgi:hypothetical protein